MKNNLNIFFAFILGTFFFSSGVYSKNCDTTFVTKEKNLKKTYAKLSEISLKCGVSSDIFLEHSEKAILAERPIEALWSAQKGIWRLKPNSNQELRLRLYLARGTALLKLNRYEEAIIHLRKASLDYHEGRPVWGQKREIVQRAYLMLVKTYFEKENEKISKDVLFLISLFNEKFPKSPYLSLVKNWLKENR
ncbi:MAG: tetratricopeptide repeat protein [Spirochaetia bacterium]|nr:tetratricopeptide repeat protein [Spirochaetia bacterium]